ncbi:Glycosyltransferase [Acidisarcina polymorpha]|uniref:Glycosyltransferase n=1 Tax=Acidisarcina polymorpha TaxID=2211140 RepID=A0A2Z5G2J2_9BACT|nr:glycosyltransferase [Acidisarcina polymorpha]AXC13423.1 Glycosyltransferase [Acidisarcina polymorpha]
MRDTSSTRIAGFVVMRFLHTIHSLSPESGGPAEGLRQLAEKAHTSGIYETEVVSLDDPSSAFLQSASSPLQCAYMTAHAVGPGLGKYGYTQRLDQWLEKNLSRFNGVVINGLWQYHAYAAWKACRETLPYLVFTHGMLDPWFKRHYPIKHLKKAVYWGAVEHRVLRDALSVMFTSSLEAELARESFWPSQWNSVVSPYGTGEPPQDRESVIREFYGRCPRVCGHPFMLFLGRLHEKKGCDLLVEAFARQARAHPAVHLIMAGPDQQGWIPKLVSFAVRQGLRDRVHFPGMLQAGAKWGAFYAADVFVLPSHQENFGIAVAEALACGTPVLISNKVNIWREIMADGVGLVENDDLEGTERLLERWGRMSAVEKTQMAERCHSSFKRRFDLNQTPRIIADQFATARKL